MKPPISCAPDLQAGRRREAGGSVVGRRAAIVDPLDACRRQVGVDGTNGDVERTLVNVHEDRREPTQPGRALRRRDVTWSVGVPMGRTDVGSRSCMSAVAVLTPLSPRRSQGSTTRKPTSKTCLSASVRQLARHRRRHEGGRQVVIEHRHQRGPMPASERRHLRRQVQAELLYGRPRRCWPVRVVPCPGTGCARARRQAAASADRSLRASRNRMTEAG